MGNGIWEVYIERDKVPSDKTIARVRGLTDWKVNERTLLVTSHRVPWLESVKEGSSPAIIGMLGLLVC